MESKTIGFCAVVAVLGIISAATGFTGEFTRVKDSDVYIEDNSCVYPSSPALALGVISALFAIITQIYISVTFGCCRCCGNNTNSTPISKLLSVLSWCVLDINLIVRVPGIFAAGALLALLSAVFGIAAFVTVAPLATQTTTNPAVAYPIGANIDPEKNTFSFSSTAIPPSAIPSSTTILTK
ncbi:hypothetical protein HanPI659440_Chr07g0253281 [Helianthus annuus]|nr:hypothetical protein HanHA300_Chr07g0231801 [Helianthus annuus]KAJ0555597.1 hypothetical protein HanIR_Chr07g0303931 [Helianthus annuus]KAJ0562235.1 hypothetical protein HanHA89_Chr07g0248961 [Helianthus annuus]KAJ0727611.1 hypothetical protein HanLR1_Chr07g0231771 [Helianthus annuus]KAJ0730410.1 hypothetical protein HanOQP8_Chr07g0239701 [Helianthus annuus]